MKRRKATRAFRLSTTNSQSTVKKKIKKNRPDYFGSYKKIFVARMRRKPHIIKRLGREWQTVHRFLQEDRIQKHLEGQFWVGCRGGEKTNFTIIDLDLHIRDEYGLPTADFYKQREAILGLFPKAIEIQSSASGGRHFLLPWARAYPTRIVKQYTKNRFEREGLECEVYPSGRGIRLPFGKDSYIIIDEDGRPLEGGWEEQVRFFLDSPRATIRDIFQSKDRELRRAKRRKKRSSRRMPEVIEAGPLPEITKPQFFRDTDWVKDVKRSIREGVRRHGTRHDQQLAIAQYFKLLGYTDDFIVRFLFDWGMTKHNNLSDQVRNPKRFWRTCENIVKYTRGPSQPIFSAATAFSSEALHIPDITYYTHTQEGEGERGERYIVYTSGGRVVSPCDINNYVISLAGFFAARKGEEAVISRNLMMRFGGCHGSPNYAAALKKWAIEEGFLEIAQRHYYKPGSFFNKATRYGPGAKLKAMLEKIKK